MTNRSRQLAVLVAGSVLLAGCATSRADTQAGPVISPSPSAMAPGMVMPDGTTMDAGTTATSGAGAGRPSASAAMICSADTRSDLKTVLALKAPPVGTATWANHLYTCTYALPMGKLVLSVKESADTAGTANYLTALRRQLPPTSALSGLTEAAYGTDDGTVVLSKDNDVLRVDATALPATFGSQHQKRTDFAYEIASDILGCWTGD